jgi:hypothetical protein
VVLGGTCHLNRCRGNQCCAKNFEKCRLHGRLLDEAPLAKAKCSSLCASSDKDVSLDDEDYYCARNHKAASKFFGQRVFRPKYWAPHSAVSDGRRLSLGCLQVVNDRLPTLMCGSAFIFDPARTRHVVYGGGATIPLGAPKDCPSQLPPL